MILDLREITAFPAELTASATEGQIKADFDSLKSVEAVTMEVTVQKVGDNFYCKGEVLTRATLFCSRCLVSFATKLVSKVDFTVCSEREQAGQEGVIDDEDYALVRWNDLRADVSEIARQAIGLGIELMPLCNEDCLGLCPKCGTNRNKKQCDCNDEIIDERWSALKDLTGK